MSSNEEYLDSLLKAVTSEGQTESLSDISDIVKKEEPVIKEARKRNEKTLEEKEVKKVSKKTSNNNSNKNVIIKDKI